MPLDDVKGQIAELMSSVKEFKSTNDENIKKSDALNEEKMKKLGDSIADTLEEIQKGAAEEKERADRLEAALNRSEKEGEDATIEKERQEVFNNWLRDPCDSKKSLTILDQKQAEAKAMSTEVNPDGGYIVRPEFADFIIGRIFETTPMRQLANVENIGRKSLEIVIDDDEAEAVHGSEGGTVCETDTPELGLLEITAHKYHAEPKVTEEMLEDGEFDVESWLQRKVARKISRLENTDFTSGNGVNKAKGILSYDPWSGTSYTRNKLEQVSSGSAAAVTADGIIDLQNALIEEYQANATWLMKRATHGLIMKLKDGQGQYLFNMSLDKNTGLPNSTILGRPVMFGNDMATVGADSLSIAYGDFREGYTIVDRRGIIVLRDPYTAKGFIKFYTTKRTGGAVTNFEAIKIQKIEA